MKQEEVQRWKGVKYNQGIDVPQFEGMVKEKISHVI